MCQKGRPDKKGIETMVKRVSIERSGSISQKGRPDKKGIETL